MSLISRPPRRVVPALAGLVVVVTLLVPALGSAASTTSSKTTTTTAVASPDECGATQLSFSRPSPVSAQLGEDGFTFTLTNVSARTCEIHGVPTLRFYASDGRLLQFAYSRHSQYFPYHAPRLVTLAPHARAYFLVAKYRCDLGDRFVSSYFSLLAPDARASRVIDQTGVRGPGVMDYCKGSSRGPGRTIGVSAIVASKVQLFNLAN